MKNRFIMLGMTGLMLGAAALPTPAGETRIRTKLYFAHRAEKPPVLDGVLDDACWRTADAIGDFGLRQGGASDATPKTQCRAVYDADYLYFGVDCKEPAMDKLRESLKVVSRIFFKDCLEIYLDTEHDHKSYVCLWANAVGEKSSEKLINKDWAMQRDDSFSLWARYDYAPKMNADGWTVEARIALKDLRIEPKEGTVIGFNPCRFWMVGGQILCWATIGFPGMCQKNAALYGDMVLGPTPADLGEVVKRIYPNYRENVIEIPRLENMIVVEHGQTRVMSYADMFRQRLGNVDQRLGGAEAELAQAGNIPAAKDLQTVLAKCKTECDAARAESQVPGPMPQGKYFVVSGALDGVEKKLNVLEWRIRYAVKLDRLIAQAPAAK